MNEFTLRSGNQGVIAYKSSNPFEFFHILNSKDQDEQDMHGTLIFPEKKKTGCSSPTLIGTLWKLVPLIY